MICRAVAWVSAAILLTVGTPEHAQEFRAQTDAVTVDVAVLDHNRPVTGLHSQDFTLTDNGQPQSIDVLSAGGVPIDVSLVLDVSNEAFVHRRIGDFRSDAQHLAALLRADDRLRIIADSTCVEALSPMEPPSRQMILNSVPVGGGTSTYDSLSAALMRRAEPGRRHLVIAFTEAVDYFSVLSPDAMVSIARRTDALLFVVFAQTWTGGYGRGRLTVPNAAQAFVTAAEATGGTTQLFGRSVVDSLQQLLADFHSRYLLHYRPSRVDRTGWHDIAVTAAAPAGRRYEVRARKGYYMSNQ